MRALPVMLVVAALGIPMIPAASPADDLSELAARAKERRKGKQGKVFTEEDLKQKDHNVRAPNQPEGANPNGGDLKIVFNFPTDGSTVYAKVPLNAQVIPVKNVEATFSVNDASLGKGGDSGGWINKTWDTTSLSAGSYTIKVDVRDASGKTGSAKVTVTVSKTVPVDPVVASCKPSSAAPLSGVFGLNNPYGEDQRAISEMKELGAKWVRRDFSWENIELVQGTYDWDYSDMVVVLAHDAGLQVLGTANVAPTWADKVDWPARYTAFRAFMQAVVDRYKPGGTLSLKQGWKDGYGVSYWEMWNEPNDSGAGWHWPPNPEQYTMMLANGAAGVRASSSDAFVVFGGLSNIGISPAGFVQYVYTLGAKDCFDILATHPYGYLDRFDTLVGTMRTVLAQYGNQNKPIWFTEYGTLSEQNRDAEVTKVWAQKDVAQGFFWFGLRDSPDQTWGFLTNSWEKKQPAYKTLKDLLAVQ